MVGFGYRNAREIECSAIFSSLPYDQGEKTKSLRACLVDSLKKLVDEGMLEGNRKKDKLSSDKLGNGSLFMIGRQKIEWFSSLLCIFIDVFSRVNSSASKIAKDIKVLTGINR